MGFGILELKLKFSLAVSKPGCHAIMICPTDGSSCVHRPNRWGHHGVSPVFGTVDGADLPISGHGRSIAVAGSFLLQSAGHQSFSKDVAPDRLEWESLLDFDYS